MRDSTVIEDFKKSWDFSRGMTIEFIKELPDNMWEYTPNKRYAPLCKQFRHMIWVTGLYREAIQTKKMRDCESKKEHYTGSTTKEDILKGFEVEQKKLDELLKELEGTELEDCIIQAFGLEMRFVEFTHALIQHESTHQGLWSFYATLGEFKTPKSWQENWGI
ncbi:MAG: DinB family protein [Bdellovibrionales bacterium]|nr:DinB family protein [Bdellovibrionales bacterium]